MKHYRINKLTKPDGTTVKSKDILASDDGEAVERARDDDDCPVCEVYRAGKKVGDIV
jgi:hypothetical protein